MFARKESLARDRQGLAGRLVAPQLMGRSVGRPIPKLSWAKKEDTDGQMDV